MLQEIVNFKVKVEVFLSAQVPHSVLCCKNSAKKKWEYLLVNQERYGSNDIACSPSLSVLRKLG